MEKAFQLVIDTLYAELEKQGFSAAQTLEDPAGPAAIFTTDSVAYSVLYDEQGKKFLLRSTSVVDGKPAQWKVISTWLYDEETGSTPADAQSIGNDFVETVSGPKRMANVQAIRQQQKKKKTDDENYIEPQFFFNRLAAVYPELKDEMNEERIVYGKVRFVWFAQNRILPRVTQTLLAGMADENCEKVCKLLCDTYENGDKDTRSIITAVLLNGVESDEAIAVIEPYFGTNLKPLYKCSRKLRDKNIRPEKPPKKSRVVAQSLKAK